MSADNGQIKMRKSPGLAGLLSLMPGIGQIYIGYYTAGFTNIAVVAITISILESGSARNFEPFFGLFLAFFWVFNIVDAVRKAKLYNLSVAGEQPERAPTDSPLVGGVLLIIVGLIMTLHVTLGLSMDWLEDFWPLLLLGFGVYLIWKYRRTRSELQDRTDPYRAVAPSVTPPPPAPVPSEPSSPSSLERREDGPSE